ncbi:MAG: GDP-D-mannose dehydratase [Sphingobacteriales bacterium]|jgi:GDP-D-mannose dehydratase
MEDFFQNVVKVRKGNLSKMFVHNLDEKVANTSVRELLRISFSAVGIEVEFSGKGKHEKGVLIDINESILKSHNSTFDHLHFGTTLIQVDGELPSFKSNDVKEDQLEQYIKSNIQKILKN